MTLYQTLKANGAKIGNHESDLYFRADPKSVKILLEFPDKSAIAEPFENMQTGELWFDVPFAYDPWWDHKQLGKPLPQEA